MKKITITMIIAFSWCMLSVPLASAQMATIDEALMVADNWIVRVMENEGYWGSSDWAEVEDIQEFKRNDRVIGYFCRINPIGFIVVSLRKELAPVKAYSATCDIDPESNKGMADLLKIKIEGVLDAIEQPIRLYGVDAAQALLEIDYRPAWDELCGQIRDFSEDYELLQNSNSVSQIGPLLSTSWHQGDPYNMFCPEGDNSCGDCCPEDGDPDFYCPPSDRTVVGCVATAAAQIMKYWNWPPYGIESHSYNWDGDDSCPEGGSAGKDATELNAIFSDDYDWLNMPDSLTASSNLIQIRAVAELCYKIGVAVEMDYGVCSSSANISDMNDAYGDYFRYYTYGIAKRYDNQNIWLDYIQGQLRANKPIHYRITKHQLVLDGWREDGGTTMRQYHMNYGWGVDCDDPTGCNTWYSLDALYSSDNIDEERIIADIYPAQALGTMLSGTYSQYSSFPYRYFIQDTMGENVTFAAGQNLQFLLGVTVTCENGYIWFESETNNRTRLFSIKGTKQAEILIRDGGIKLHPGGGLKFH